MRKTSINWSSFFQIALEGVEEWWRLCLEEFWPFNAFFMLKIKSSNYCLIKIRIMCVHIKPDVEKNDTRAMTASISEACVGWLHENCYLARKIFLVREMSKFFAAKLDSRPTHRVSHKSLEKWAGQFILGGRNKQD